VSVRWQFEVISRSGVPVAALVPETFKLTRRLKRSSFADITLRSESIGADDIDHTRIVRAWRNPDTESQAQGTIRFAGQFTSIQDTGDEDGNEVSTVRADDPFAALAERLIQEETVYTAEDQGDLIADLIADQNAREPTHLTMGSYSATVDRDRTYEQGKVVGEAIEQLSDVIDGPYFVINAVDDDEVVGEFVLRHPDSGQDFADAVRFEYGIGTMRNVARITVDANPPINRVLAVGATAADEGDPLLATAEDADSIDDFGMRERFISQTDVLVQDTLDDAAESEIYADPVKAYQLTAASPDSHGGNALPRLFDDFDVGDTVTLHAEGRSPRLQFEVTARVIEVVVTVGTEGEETLSSIVVEVIPDA
jgi:antitoxin (DNA-binding transcriptional repressor) of toxin-antitoxin stability system